MPPGPAPLYVARNGGTRYHVDHYCEGLNSTLAAGAPVDQIGRGVILHRRLLPCALCRPPQVPLLAVV